MHPRRFSPRIFVGALLIAGASLLFSGCASTDAVRAAQGSMNRAMRVEKPAAFFVPVLARARGEPATSNLSAEARQHYLAIIADLETLMPRDREDLRRAGLLGDALALRAVAQWRLGRLDAADKTEQEVRAAGLEPLNTRQRVLLAALRGVVRLEAAIAAAKAGAPYDKITEIIRGDGGAWKLLGLARGVAAQTDEALAPLIEARLAAFKILKDARDRHFAGVILPAGGDEAWERVRAEAQVELGDLAALPESDAAAHAARVRLWQGACGLDLVSR